MVEGIVVKRKLIWFGLLGVLTISLLLLTASVDRVRTVFAKMADVKVSLELREPSIQGLELTCKGELSVNSPVPFEVEILQVKLMNQDGVSFGHRALDGIAPNEPFSFKIQDPKLFQQRGSTSVIKYVGFARIKFKIGRYGLKLDFPLSGIMSVRK